MKNMKDFNNILDECIERLLKGDSVEACLEAFPEHAAELEPLLLTAVDARKASEIMPRPEFRQRAGYEFQAAIRDMKPVKSGFRQWHLRWVSVISVIIVILLAGGSTVAASANSLPDESLYGVKLFTEEVRLALTPSTLGKAQLYAEFTDARVAEIIIMADEGNVDQVVQATERMSSNLIAIAKLIQPNGDYANSATGGEPQMLSGIMEDAVAPSSDDIATSNETVPLSAMKAVALPDEGFQRSTVAADPVPATISEKNEKDAKNGKVALNNAVAEQALKNTRDLQEVLLRAPESVKPALEKAIEIASVGYEQALNNSGKQK